MNIISYPHTANLLGTELSIYWIIPFIGILLSIAILPLIKPALWHHHYGKISIFWSLSLLAPLALWKGVGVALFHFLDVLLLEYLPFIILLLSLYTISGGIRLKGRLSGTPKGNFLIILTGTVLASWMGTTGASMLLIRPIIQANKWRQHNVHTIVFFIFLVANI